MPLVYTARIADASSEAASSSTRGEPSPLRLRAYALSLSPQALSKAYLFFQRAARILCERGLLVWPNVSAQQLVVLMPEAKDNEAGITAALTWLLPLLPAHPIASSSGKKSASASSTSKSSQQPWSLLFRALDSAAANDEEEGLQPSTLPKRVIDIGAGEGWIVEVQMASSSSSGKGAVTVGVQDSVIQACIAHAVRLELNRQGWSLIGGRFVRIPTGCVPSGSIPAVELDLTLANQSELTIFINVASVKFNPIATKPGQSVEGMRYEEMIVKVLPDLNDAMIMRVVGESSSSSSLGVDRSLYAESYGIPLPSSFPVVNVKMNNDDAFGRFPTQAVPLCCCLTSGLTPVTVRAKDTDAMQRMNQEHAAIAAEITAILKALRILSPSTGSLAPLLAKFESKQSDQLLQALNPLATKGSAPDTIISSGAGFQKASSLSAAAAGDGGEGAGSKRKYRALTIPKSSALTNGNSDAASSSSAAGAGVSLAALKARMTLPPPTSNFGSSFGWDQTPAKPASSSSFLSSAGWDESKEQRTDDSTERGAEDADTPAPAKKRQKTPLERLSAARVAERLSAARVASSSGTLGAAKPKIKLASAAAAKPTTAVPAASSSSKKAKETEAQRAARKEREKAEKAAAKAAAKQASKSASKSKSKSTAAAPWAADFAAAFDAMEGDDAAAAAAAPTAASLAAFRQAMGPPATVGAGASTTKPAATTAAASTLTKASKSAKSSSKASSKQSKKPTSVQTKLNFTAT